MDEQTPARLWWPEFLVDEVVPEGRAHPSDWIVGLNTQSIATPFYVVGDAEDEIYEDVQIDDVMPFLWREINGRFLVRIEADGSFTALAEVLGATHFWQPGDPDTMSESLAQFCRDYAENATPADGDLDDPVEVEAYTWSDPIPFRLVIEDGKPRFVEARIDA